MKSISFDNKLTLAFEPLGKKVRLIVLATDKELVCRKETVKNLQQFLASNQTNIFKGRLQLNKRNQIIEVIVKDRPTSVISAEDFGHILNNLQ